MNHREVQGVVGGVIPWGGAGDINAGFAFLLDCVVNLFVLSALLMMFGFPSEIIQTRMVPGALVGIIVGNLLNVYLARKAARRTGNPDLTAMPLGLDITTTVGFTVAVLGPVFLLLKQEMGDAEAAVLTWYVGMGGAIWMGLIKFGLSFLGRAVQRILPLSALLGSMVGISIVWLGANAILGTFSIPEVGMVSLAVMVYALIAGHKLPGALPGAIAAIVLGTLAYYALGGLGVLEGFVWPEVDGVSFSVPIPTLGGFEELFGRALFYMAVIVPFALLIAASTINLTAGANVVGDQLDSGDLMRADGVATIVSALFGGVIQTTPYFGHATYKRMGARTAYSLGVSAVLAVGGVFGIIGLLIDILPDATLKPVLIVVACDILRLAFRGVSVDQAPALSFAAMPAIINFAFFKVSELFREVQGGLERVTNAVASMEDAARAVAAEAQAFLPEAWMQSYVFLGAMSRGYILIGLLWASAVAYVINKQFKLAAMSLFIAAGLALFGVIHSVLPTSSVYFPWALDLDSAFAAALPYR
ncbi:MAG: hypothetical protein ACE5EM_10940, partial [Sphingomonadales bacterium]